MLNSPSPEIKAQRNEQRAHRRFEVQCVSGAFWLARRELTNSQDCLRTWKAYPVLDQSVDSLEA
jgi:hypothetical protein